MTMISRESQPTMMVNYGRVLSYLLATLGSACHLLHITQHGPLRAPTLVGAAATHTRPVAAAAAAQQRCCAACRRWRY